MLAQILKPTPETSYIVSRLLYEKHIYDAVDDRLHDVWHAHIFFRDIERGKTLVIGVFQKESNAFLGCVIGDFFDSCFSGHILFKRKVDVKAAVLLCEEELKRYCHDAGIALREIIGNIPEYNRAALCMARKAGYMDSGEAVDFTHFKNGKVVSCRCMRKEI